MMKFFKNNTSNILFVAFGLILFFSTDAKAYLQQGLMKVGFFQPQFDYIETKPTPTHYLNFQLLNDEGKVISLGDLKGKVVFLNFWATWCPPCIAEMPSIQVLHDKFKADDEVVILTVEVEGKKEKANQFMQRKKLDLPLYYPYSAIPSELFKGSLPTTIILDKEGYIAHTTFGMADYSGQDIVDFLNEIKAIP